jgi:RecB family endonuclease NucS
VQTLGLPFPTKRPAEVLGEKALSQGHIDILVKEAIPFGVANKIVIEVKRDVGAEGDVTQLKRYVAELGNECAGAVLVAKRFRKNVVTAAKNAGIVLVNYRIEQWQSPLSYSEIADAIHLEAH